MWQLFCELPRGRSSVLAGGGLGGVGCKLPCACLDARIGRVFGLRGVCAKLWSTRLCTSSFNQCGYLSCPSIAHARLLAPPERVHSLPSVNNIGLLRTKKLGLHYLIDLCTVYAVGAH